jgi:hypothetical protein
MRSLVCAAALVVTIAATVAAPGPLSLANPPAARACAGTQIDPVFLDKLSVDDARKLDGLRLYVAFTIDAPPVEYNTETITGPTSADAKVERGVHFPTRRAARLERQRANVSACTACCG